MPTSHAARGQHSLRRENIFALTLCCLVALLPLACGDGNHDQNPQFTAQTSALPEFAHSTLVRLNTASLARAVQAGKEIQLPFAYIGGGTANRKVQLTLRNMRAADLAAYVLKNGNAGTGTSAPLPPPATYQGRVRNGGSANFTLTESVVEGSMLTIDGWSFIEPLEPLLRLRNVSPDTRAQLLKRFNHVVYNVRDLGGHVLLNDDPGPSQPVGAKKPSGQLVMSMVADGDPELLRAYPLDSVMPFWLKQETLLNSVDWLYNCIEPEANADNAYADCGNDFDGGSNAFQATVRIDRLEVWTTGGPDSNRADISLEQSITMTHQASPVCCGEPHTAGHSSLVHFFSGRGFEDRAGEAWGTGGVNNYGPGCFSTTDRDCHHAISQLVPTGAGSNFTFHGNVFEQQALVSHEIGHNNNAPEVFTNVCPVCWLFDTQCGNCLMASQGGFSSMTQYLYDEQAVVTHMGPLLAERLTSPPVGL